MCAVDTSKWFMNSLSRSIWYGSSDTETRDCGQYQCSLSSSKLGGGSSGKAALPFWLQKLSKIIFLIYFEVDFFFCYFHMCLLVFVAVGVVLCISSVILLQLIMLGKRSWIRTEKSSGRWSLFRSDFIWWSELRCAENYFFIHHPPPLSPW